jgi:hypothetical protein
LLLSAARGICSEVAPPAKQLELRRRRRNTERDFVDAVAIQLEITTAAVAELCR